MLEFVNKHLLKPWELELIDKYPFIYLEPNTSFLEYHYTPERAYQLQCDPNFVNLRYGFEFGEEHKDAVDMFSKKVQDMVIHLRETGIQPDAYVRACIFKEKFKDIVWQGDDNLTGAYADMFVLFLDELHKETRKTTWAGN